MLLTNYKSFRHKQLKMILYYHCFSGISGDMNLAAMIDMGVPIEYLLQELKKLNIDGYSIDTKTAIKLGISGTQVNVNLTHSTHHHDHEHSHEHHHDHSHRTFKNIKKIILDSTLEDSVKETSISIFEKVAIAEGKVHNKPAEDVHFHEVGAVDSIVDIVGAAICYHYLKPEKVMCSTIELGGGFVKCAHGNYPVPAPATAEIISNLPVSKGRVQFETTTPTGAAILATLVDEFSDNFNLTIKQTAYGIGHKDLDIPNVLRVFKASENKINTENSEAIIIECNLDDMTGEQIGFVTDKLLEKGAQDAFVYPITMKKSRPAHTLSVLCSKDKEDELTEILLLDTTTFGVRSYQVKKTILERSLKKVETKYGIIDVKIAYLKNKAIKYKPEYEYCKKAAEKHKIPINEVIQEVMFILKRTTNE